MADKDIARLNVEHFRKLLATDIEDVKRHTILRLLAEEEAKLAVLSDSPAQRQINVPQAKSR